MARKAGPASDERVSPDTRQKVTSSALVVLPIAGQKGLRVIGAVDVSTRRDWDDALAALHADDAAGRLDLSGLSFIDARGAASLVDAARRMAPTTNLTLYRPPPSLRRILDVFWSDEEPAIVIEDEEAR
jgi:anti-anti-sigma regulatory factor